MPDQDPWEEAAKNFKGQTGATAPAAAASGNDDWKLWTKTSQPTTTEPSMMQKIGSTGLDLLKGAGEGALHTVNSLGGMLSSVDPSEYLANKVIPGYQQHMAQANQQAQELERPTNTAQSIGRGIEQAGEFLIPGGAEEKVAGMAGQLLPKAAKLVVPAVRTGMAALDSGALNKVQGGSFGAGAAAGGVGSALGAGVRAVAPKLAESALGIKRADRAFGKTPGEAIINETKGVRPSTIAASAKGTLGKLNPQLDAAAAASTTPASLNPALNVAGDAINKAVGQNAGKTVEQLQPMQDFLTKNISNGLPLSPTQSASGILNLKRGFGSDFLHNWNPETLPGVTGTGRNIYHALDSELDRTVPEAQGINQRISSLIPVEKNAESLTRGPGVLQRSAHRIAAHTGAATAGVGGSIAGYREGGVPGAFAGGLSGILAPELLASPTGQMIVARGMASPATRKIILPLAQGGALQANR